MRRSVSVFAGLAIVFALTFTSLSAVGRAQGKPVPGFADYGQWETLAAGGVRAGGGGLAPNGRWVAYAINRTNGSNELRITNVADATTKTVAFGTQPAYSADSKWLAYSIGHSEAEAARATPGSPLQNKLGLMNLQTGETTSIDGIEAFSFSPDGVYLAMRKYSSNAGGPGGGAAAGGGGRGAGGADNGDVPVGVTVIVRQLASGRDTTLGNVGEYAWQDAEQTHLLALTISADGKIGNGVQLFDPESTVLRVLESSQAAYSSLVWRKDSAGLAVMRAKTDDKHDGATYAVIAWTGIGKNEKARTYDPTTDSTFPSGMRLVNFRRESWSDDGNTIFCGVAAWEEKAAAPPTAGRGGRGGGGGNASGGANTAAAADDPADVAIWHWTDVDVMSKQKLSVAQDRRRNLLAAWHLDTGAFVQLSTSFTESVTPIRHTNQAWVAEWAKYAMDRTIGRPSSDLYLEDLTTGARTPLKENVNDRNVQVSPDGKYLLFLLDDSFWSVNLSTRAITNITKAAPASFIDKESDETIKQKPAFGVGGWTREDDVLVYDKYDIWRVSADGVKAAKLTAGAADQVRHRLMRVGQEDEGIDLAKPVYVTLFGVWSKKSGYGVLTPGATAADRLVFLDRSVAGLAKAKDADVYAYTSQDYDVSPNIFVGGPDLKDAKQVTNTNAFQANYAWGRSETVDFTAGKTQKLQGSLYYPAGYEPGKTYPMIVYIYEKLSDGVHGYVAPTNRSYYNISVFTTQGYFVFEPDIVFTPRQPGVSVVNCVTAGVKQVLTMGAVDPKRVGVVGHSWGGFDTAYLATHTQGVFAAAVAGAPITDLVSNYGNGHWSSGIAETDHIETGQQRMEVPLYEDLKDYVDNSAVFNVANMTVPLMLECGDSDGTVFWHQSVELYNIARRAKKNVVMLVYAGEDHGLRQQKNIADYQHRILAWFGHYLKGEAAETWITNGQSVLEREAELRKIKK
jgi:dipeptidyl aminopeptidase/acylaminoacyl peptidase